MRSLAAPAQDLQQRLMLTRPQKRLLPIGLFAVCSHSFRLSGGRAWQQAAQIAQQPQPVVHPSTGRCFRPMVHRPMLNITALFILFRQP
jgi:hypothetical protein